MVALLEENKISYKVVEYLKNPLTREEVLSLSKKLNKKPIEFIRKNELDYKNNILGKDTLNDVEMAEFIVAYPKIMERPIVLKGEKAAIGRPPKNVLGLFE